MAYTPTEWQCGDALTAERFNNMERGISEMNGEYVPNEWQCGDTITAEKLNHIEQGIADGGGDSSDLSTATVTVVDNLPDDIPVDILGAFVVNGALDYRAEFPNGTSQKQVALYLGGVHVFLDYEYVSVSGNATIDGGIITITGDCTITINSTPK